MPISFQDRPISFFGSPVSLLTVHFICDSYFGPCFQPQFISVISSKVNVLNDWRADSFPKKKTTWSTTGQNGMYRGTQNWNEFKWRHSNDVISNSFYKKIFIHLKGIWNRNHLRIFWIFAEIFPRIDYDIRWYHMIFFPPIKSSQIWLSKNAR